MVLELHSCIKFRNFKNMASSNYLFPEGNSINRPPFFNGVGYHYWKTCIQIFIEAIDLNIWEAIEIRPYIPTMAAGNTTIQKPRDQWSEEEKRLVQFRASRCIMRLNRTSG